MSEQRKHARTPQDNTAIIPTENREARKETISSPGSEQQVTAIKPRQTRLSIPTATVARITPQGHYVTEDVFIRDISVYGIGGYTKTPYRKGEQLLVKLKLALSETEVIEEELIGEIRWSTLVDKGTRYAFGLQFSGVESENPVVYTYLRRLEEKFLHA